MKPDILKVESAERHSTMKELQDLNVAESSTSNLPFLGKLEGLSGTVFFRSSPNQECRHRRCRGKSVLNLFAYTGSFSVRSRRGARRVLLLTIQHLSELARDNFSLNEIETAKHEFVRADVIELKNAHRNCRTYDVIILDPLTFSNSKSTA